MPVGILNRAVSFAVTLIALLAIAAGLWQLLSAREGLEIRQARVNTIPVTAFQPTSAQPAPVVVIAHGFAGSQQLMQPFAVTLARNGHIAVSFDFPGHGRNPEPLVGGLTDHGARTRSLLEALDAVVGFARALPNADGRLALLGHSMATDVLIRYAMAHPEVAATVAVSPFTRDVTADNPRNLLIVYGALEPARLRELGEEVVAMAPTDGPVEPGVTYGEFTTGTARRLALAGGVEHIGVLYARDSLAEALDWIDRSFERRGDGFLDTRGIWLGLLFLGLVLLVRPLSGLLPRVASIPLGNGYRWRRFLVLAIIPAVLTPLILWPLPHRFLPLLLGDYLVLHFGLYGVLTLLGLWLLRPVAREPADATCGSLAVAAVAAALFVTLAIALPLDAFVASFVPTGQRVALVPAMLAGTLLFFGADEWLTRGGPRGAYFVTKICFLLSLILAVVLNLSELFFLLIIIPAILVFFIVYGLFSHWLYRRTRHPLVAAFANAVAFAWAIAVTFPIVGG